MPQPDPHGLGPLFERSRQGDGAARGELHGRLRPYLKALVRSWLGPDPDGGLDPSSIAQESLLRIEKGWPGFRGRTVPELLGWARRIAFNLTSDRKKGLAGAAAVGGEAVADAAADEPAPLDVLIHEEDAARLAAALEQLPEPRRAVIVARLLDDLPFEEVARRLGRTNGAVRVLFLRAVAQLRQILENES
jgi:RNA polymerase sigma-70 factor (ECF subfamily)